MKATGVAVNLQNTRLGGLQSLRALAAFAVCLQHAIYYACASLGIDFMPYLRVGIGGTGVNLFFVISGFVMAGCLHQGRRFLWNRVVRVYPAYWLAIALSALLLWAPLHGWHFDWPSALLIPAALNHSYHIPYWTLIYEMGFYVLVGALIATRCSAQAMSRFCVLWLLAVAVVSRYTEISIAEPGVWLWLASHNIFFIAGFLLGLHYGLLKNLPSLLLSLAGVIGCTLGEIFYAISPAGAFMLYAPGLACVVILGVRHLKVGWLERLGDASYGIYLLHAPIMATLVAALSGQFSEDTVLLLMLLCFLSGCVGAAAFGHLEFHLYQRIKRLTHVWARRQADTDLPR